MRTKLTSLGEAVGLAVASAGVWSFHAGAGLIAVGLSLVAVSYAQGDGG